MLSPESLIWGYLKSHTHRYNTLNYRWIKRWPSRDPDFLKNTMRRTLSHVISMWYPWWHTQTFTMTRTLSRMINMWYGDTFRHSPSIRPWVLWYLQWHTQMRFVSFGPGLTSLLCSPLFPGTDVLSEVAENRINIHLPLQE